MQCDDASCSADSLLEATRKRCLSPCSHSYVCMCVVDGAKHNDTETERRWASRTWNAFAGKKYIITRLQKTLAKHSKNLNLNGLAWNQAFASSLDLTVEYFLDCISDVAKKNSKFYAFDAFLIHWANSNEYFFSFFRQERDRTQTLFCISMRLRGHNFLWMQTAVLRMTNCRQHLPYKQ